MSLTNSAPLFFSNIPASSLAEHGVDGRESKQGVRAPKAPPAPFLPLPNEAENATEACRRPGGGEQEVQSAEREEEPLSFTAGF